MGQADGLDVRGILTRDLPGTIAVEKAEESDDRNGIDYWAVRSNDRPLGVDVKFRRIDPVQEYGKDDLALETYSSVKKGTPGWTRDERKHTDYILWVFGPTGRVVLIPFPLLCGVFQENWREWRGLYGPPRCQQSNGGGGRTWVSEHIYVPRVKVWRGIYDRYGGRPTPHIVIPDLEED
jgi:hypothetical protein